MQRCTNPASDAYPLYGARGIIFYDEWTHNPQSFYDHISQLPHFGEKGYTLDRIDNDGNYEPGNVRWASNAEQNRNMRSNHLLTYQGRTQCLADWAEETGLSARCISGRLARGWSVGRTLTTPSGR